MVDGAISSAEVRSDAETRHHEVIIAGAGFGGLGVAVELNRIGLADFAILEKAQDVGGTWRDNNYPGLEVANHDAMGALGARCRNDTNMRQKPDDTT